MMRQLLGMLREAMARVGHQYSYQFQREWAQCGCLAIVFIAAGLGGCERQPFFRVPPKDTGGIALQCLGITDFGRRPQIGAGASNCAEFGSGIDYPLPEVSAEGNALGAVVFNDPLCTTTIASACVPKVIATTNEWEEPGLAPGHLHLERQLLRQENLLHPTLLGIDDSGSTNFDVKETVRRDARGVTTSGCFLAHFGFLSAKYVSSGVYRDPGGVWVAGVKFYEETYGHFTNVADSLAIGEFWGYSGGPSIPVENSYGNKVAGPAPYLCNEGETGGNGFGFRAVGVFSASGFESNPNSPVMERQSSCPEGDCELQPLNYDLALEPSSSMGTITISNGSESESADVGVKGSLQIQATECRRGANDVVSCDAKIVGSVLSVSAFELANTDVEFLTIRSGLTQSAAVITGGTLVVPGYQGDGEIRLADGRFDVIGVDTGVILGTWEPEADRFQAVLAFEGELGSGVDVRFDGNISGTFLNVSPVARASALSESPLASWMSSAGTIECEGPGGTDVLLSATDSFDLDADPLRFVWRVPNASPDDILSQEPTFMVPALALGAHAFHLSANDARGQQGTDFLEFEIVDSRPPVLSVEASACVWPPNHKPFVLSLGEDVRVTASDQCEGDVSSTARFVDAVSNEADDGVADGTTTADVVFSDNTVCIRAERAGNAAGRTYTITVEASDSAGNTGISTFEVAVPHSGAAHGCVNAQEVAACAL